MRPSEIREINSRLSRVEQQISKIPSRIGSVGGGGSSGGGIRVYYGTNVSDFPDASTVEEGSFGRVTGNDQDPQGSMYVVSPDRSEWLCFTHFG